MAEMMDDIAHLSQEIGPRPAGTEEEQQAALYIADELQKSAGFSTVVEDVSCASNGNTIRLVCFLISFICTLVALIFPLLSIPSIVIGVLVAALFVFEALGKSVLSRFLRNGVSQNVVAKYNPLSITSTNKRRKIILVTHYDSARVATEYQGIFGKYLPIIRLVCAVALLIAPIILLVKAVFFASEAGGFAIVLTILQIICLVLMALPLIGIIKNRFSPYNEAANNDAAGVAVLLDVARTVGNGLVSAEEMEARAREAGVEVHGEEAAREAGVIPEGAEISYQAFDQKMTPEESLAAAKAAIAALTGKPVADKVPLSDISSRLVRHGEFTDSEEEAAAAAVHFEVEEENEPRLYEPNAERVLVNESSVSAKIAEASDGEAQNEEQAESFVRESVEALQPGATGMGSSYQKQVPSWAKAAQEKARENKPDIAKDANVSRSRFADAPAAQIAEATMRRNGVAPIGVTPERSVNAEEEQDAPQETTTYQEPESELSRRLAALREEIDDAAAPLLKKIESSSERLVEDLSEGIAEDDGVAQEIYDEVAVTDDPVVVSVISPERKTPAETIAQDQTRRNAAKRKAASRRSASSKNAIGGFLGRASSMVNSVSSKVTGRRGNHAEGTVRNKIEQDIVEEDAFEDDVVLIDQMDEMIADQTVSMPQIDVEQFADDQVMGQEEAIISEETEYEFVPIEQEAVMPIVGMEEMVNDVAVVSEETVATTEEQPDRHVIVLPDVIAPVANNMEAAKQRAPMALDADQTQPQAALLSNMLPRVGADLEDYQPSGSSLIPPLGGLDLPDFNTDDFERVIVPPIIPLPEIDPIKVDQEDVAEPLGSAGSTGSFAQVGSDLVEEADDDFEYVEDADDSVFEEGFTQTGAFAGPDYVEMPKSRVGRLFGRFGKKKRQEEKTVAEWVDVDESYEASLVGEQRGDWESFRDSGEGNTEIFEMDYEAVDGTENNGRDWNGGAFSLQSLRDRVSGNSSAKNNDDLEEFAEHPIASDNTPKRTAPQSAKIAEEINNEMRLLRDFRHPDIDTEVWFVALGAEEALNSGMKAFIEEHAEELKGATIINLEGLGAGRFSFIDEEGEYRPNKASSRLKRVLRQASEKSGVPFATAKLLSRNTAAHVAAQHGFQAMTLAGMEGDQTAYYGSINDTVDMIEPETLKQNSRFVLDILKSV